MDAGARAARAGIRPVKEQVEDELLAIPGVVGVDIGEKVSGGAPTGLLGIVVYVRRKRPASALPEAERIPRSLAGVVTDVQELEVELQGGSRRVEDGVALVDPARHPTLTGGISMGPARSFPVTPTPGGGPDDDPGGATYVGTLGALVADRSSGAVMALTNFHVAGVDAEWSTSDRMVHPARPDGGSPVDDQFGTLARAVLTEAVDAAVVAVDADRAWEPRVADVGDVAGSLAADVDLPVQKRGRTTERTFGSVGSVDFTVRLDYGPDLGGRTLRRQVLIRTDPSRSVRFSAGGDSGSVVLTEDRHVVGLLFAGSVDGTLTFANPVHAVLDAMEVDLLTPAPPG